MGPVCFFQISSGSSFSGISFVIVLPVPRFPGTEDDAGERILIREIKILEIKSSFKPYLLIHPRNEAQNIVGFWGLKACLIKIFLRRSNVTFSTFECLRQNLNFCEIIVLPFASIKITLDIIPRTSVPSTSFSMTATLRSLVPNSSSIRSTSPTFPTQ